MILDRTLLERELRLALRRSGEEFLRMYPESRPCRRPTTRRLLDVFEPIQRRVLALPDGTEQTMVTQLTDLQRQALSLIQISPSQYGV